MGLPASSVEKPLQGFPHAVSGKSKAFHYHLSARSSFRVQGALSSVRARSAMVSRTARGVCALENEQRCRAGEGAEKRIRAKRYLLTEGGKKEKAKPPVGTSTAFRRGAGPITGLGRRAPSLHAAKLQGLRQRSILPFMRWAAALSRLEYALRRRGLVWPAVGRNVDYIPRRQPRQSCSGCEQFRSSRRDSIRFDINFWLFGGKF